MAPCAASSDWYGNVGIDIDDEDDDDDGEEEEGDGFDDDGCRRHLADEARAVELSAAQKRARR